MDAANAIDSEAKQKCQQHRLQPGGHHLAVRLTAGLKAASNKTETLAKTKPAQLIGAAVLGGCLVIALSLFKAKKPPRNNNIPASFPQVSGCARMQSSLQMYSSTVSDMFLLLSAYAVQMGLAWHWARFKESYMANDDDSCSASCYHLRAVQAAARQKVCAHCLSKKAHSVAYLLGKVPAT